MFYLILGEEEVKGQDGEDKEEEKELDVQVHQPETNLLKESPNLIDIGLDDLH